MPHFFPKYSPDILINPGFHAILSVGENACFKGVIYMRISSGQSYAFLFSNMGGSSVSGSSSLLADYASIKNGSYYKLMKAYYGKDSHASKVAASMQTKTKGNTAVSKDSTDTLTKIQKSTDSLKESADALLAKGNKSVFKEDNQDAVYKAVNQFVNDYNSVIKSTADSNSQTIARRSQNLITATAANSKLLSKAGITVNSDYTLSLDKEAFQKADLTTVKSLFGETGSYGYRASAQASLINFAADTEASKANTYNFNGSYNRTYTNGNLFNSYF